MFVGKARSLEHLKGASLRKAMGLLENIRLGWKLLPRTNTIAYYKHSKISEVKSFITLGPGLVMTNK
jgi:hypothetical protein